MKSMNILIGAVLCALCMTSQTVAQNSVMTFNIRYDNPMDGVNWWEFRKEEVVDLITYYGPGILGLQEAMPHQAEYIAEALPSYQSIGHGRDGEGTDSEGVPILYNENIYTLENSEVFWLSETPEKASKGWDAALNRIVTYGLFREKRTGNHLHVFNAHFDHQGKLAREKSAELLIDKLAEMGLEGERVIIMGDLNALPNHQPVKLLSRGLQDAYQVGKTYPVYGPIGTFTGFEAEKVATERIDYIFTKNLEVSSYRCVDDRRRDGHYVSDHYPILIKCK